MKSLNELPIQSLNSMDLGKECAKELDSENRPSIPSIELLICEEEEVKRANHEQHNNPIPRRQEVFKHRNNTDFNSKRPAALKIRTNPGLSRFGLAHQKAQSQNSNICDEDKKIEPNTYSTSHPELSK